MATVYFKNAITGAEIPHRCAGWQHGTTTGTWDARGRTFDGLVERIGVSRRTGEFIDGMPAAEAVEITAADFPGVLVEVHVWGPGYRDRMLLVGPSQGFDRANNPPEHRAAGDFFGLPNLRVAKAWLAARA
jgi:hypothetical protein